MNVEPTGDPREIAVQRLISRAGALPLASREPVVQSLGQLANGSSPPGQTPTQCVAGVFRALAAVDGLALNGVGRQGDAVRPLFVDAESRKQAAQLMEDLRVVSGVPFAVAVIGNARASGPDL